MYRLVSYSSTEFKDNTVSNLVLVLPSQNSDLTHSVRGDNFRKCVRSFKVTQNI